MLARAGTQNRTRRNRRLEQIDGESVLIKTESEYNSAVERINKLFLSDLESPEASTLLRLLDDVEAYEEAKYPIAPPTPDEAKAFRKEQEQ